MRGGRARAGGAGYPPPRALRAAWAGPGAPPGPAAPPARCPLVHAGRLRKSWRWVGVFADELVLCAGEARVGPAPVRFWAIWDRRARRLHERTHLVGGRGVVVEDGRVRVRDGEVEVLLELEEGDGIEVLTPSGSAWTWTRKQAGVAARGRVRVGGREHVLDARAVVDDSLGYHPRRTSWRWAAGVGRLEDGRPVAFNVVTGLNDGPTSSERAVWVDGVAREVGPVRFAPDLGSVGWAEGGELRFGPEAVRRRRDDLGLVRSIYEQPFGTFTGTLPGLGALHDGLGVVERHEALW